MSFETETPMFLVYESKDPHSPELLQSIYKDFPISSIKMSYPNNFSSQAFFEKKFGKPLLSTPQLKNSLLENISVFLDKLAKTKVYDSANIELTTSESAPNTNDDTLDIKLNLIEKSRYKSDYSVKALSHNNGCYLDTKFYLLIRNPLQRMDHHRISYNHGFLETNDNRKGYEFKSTFPFLINSNSFFKTKFLQQSKYIEKNIEENSLSEKISIFPLDKAWRLGLRYRYLQNKINTKETSQYKLDTQIFPSNEYSLKLGRTFRNTIDKGGIVSVGQSATGNMRIAYNDTYASYIKFNATYKRYFGLFDPNTQKFDRFKYVNFENLLKLGLYIPFHKSSQKKEELLNNMISLNNNLPGFKAIGENNGDYKGHHAVLSNTFKVIFNDYPILKMIGLSPFLYTSGALCKDDLKKKNLKELIRLSGGIGVKYSFLQHDLEILYNIGHFSQKNDKEMKFQLFFC